MAYKQLKQQIISCHKQQQKKEYQCRKQKLTFHSYLMERNIALYLEDWENNSGIHQSRHSKQEVIPVEGLREFCLKDCMPSY